jgi:hypothetical protein
VITKVKAEGVKAHFLDQVAPPANAHPSAIYGVSYREGWCVPAALLCSPPSAASWAASSGRRAAATRASRWTRLWLSMDRPSSRRPSAGTSCKRTQRAACSWGTIAGWRGVGGGAWGFSGHERGVTQSRYRYRYRYRYTAVGIGRNPLWNRGAVPRREVLLWYTRIRSPIRPTQREQCTPYAAIILYGMHACCAAAAIISHISV